MVLNEEAAIRLILKANGITGPLVPLAIKVLREQYDAGEAFGSDVLGPLTGFVNPAGSIVAELGKKKRSTKQKANDKKKSVAWKKANSEGRKNNGDFRSGWNMKRIARRANKILKKL